jgi:zinc D-Ala-D-Ala carboxypeptidase
VAYSQPARTAPRRIRTRRIRATGLLVVIVVIAAALGSQLPASSSSTAPSAIEGRRSKPLGAPGPAVGSANLRGKRRGPIGEGNGAVLRSDRGAPLGQADGAVPDGTTVFDDEIPGVANLDPALLSALRRAATDAADNGVELFVDSGWRSPAYQEQLLHEAVLKYGSQAEAARWVATPSTSAHVSGDAVDIGPSAVAAWLSEHGVAYGLCRIYGNEPWHFELRPDAVGHGCPAMYADPTHDPKMERSNQR